MRLITLIVAGAVVGIMLYVLLFRFVDDSLNGAFVDWFFNTFVSTWEVDYQTGTTYNLVFNPTGAKEFFLRLGLVFVLVLVVACALTARWYARRQVKPLLKSTSELMEFYLKHDADAREVFPAGYEDIALVATDIKAETAAHERTLRDEAQRIYREAFSADYYLSSVNAISEDGVIVNIDGNGNRVAAITFGPKKVILVVGLNKVTQDVESALARARSTASPINAARFDIKTPCRADGTCHNCNSPESICNYIHFMRNSHPAGRHTVVLVGEDLGY